jgi:serine/threonine protein kinase
VKLPFQLGRYTLVELIGAGAFGRVYRAEVHGDMGFVSEFAVKVLDANVVASNPNVAAQMGDEARILAQLDHPNIVNVIDFLHEDHDVLGDVYYMVLEFVRGVDVGEILEQLLLDSRSVPATAALHMGLMVADALDHAHSLVARSGVRLDIVHRDLKPQNLMVNFRGQVKILDFGIAKARDDRMAARTQEGQTKGTIFYMSPEQLTGDNLDGRADLFSLGAILFELLMGRRLLDVEVSTPADLARAMHTAYEMDIEDRLTALRAHLEAGHNGELPDEAVEGWIALLRSALQKDPQNRPVSSGVMSEQLEWLRARHPQSDHRNFWAQQASSGLERNSGPFEVPLEDVPHVEEEPNSFTEPADFFGMDATTLAGGAVSASAVGRPEIPPPDVPVTRAMSVVEGTVRAFGSNSLRSITAPPNISAPQAPPSALANFTDDEETAADVAQTLNTPSYQPGDPPTDPDIQATMAYGEPPKKKRLGLFGRDPSRVQTDVVRSLPKTRRVGSSLTPKSAIVLLAGFAVLLGIALIGLWLSSDGQSPSDVSPDQISDAQQSPKLGADTDTEPSAVESGATTPGDGDPSAVSSAAESAVNQAEAVPTEETAAPEVPRALDPSPQKTAAERVAAERRATEAEARRAERDKLRRERLAAARKKKEQQARDAEAKRKAAAVDSQKSAAAESGVLHLSARPRCKVSIDGVAYGTTDTTRRGVKLPVGTYKVRFICDDEAECANFGRVSGIKTLRVEAGSETRYLADFYALNKKKGRR